MIPLIVTIGTWESRCGYLKKHYNIKPEKQIAYGGYSNMYIHNGCSESFIWMPTFDYNNIEAVVVLIHEIDHIAFNIFAVMNIPILDNHSNHAYIYLKEYFLTKALKKLKGV